MTSITERIGFRTLGVVALALAAYSYWAFMLDPHYAASLAAGGGALPEMRPGFIEGQAEQIFSRFSAEDVSHYAQFQLRDAPFACLNAMFLYCLLVIARRRWPSARGAFSALLALPFLNLAAELIEDAMLVADAQTPGPAALLFERLQQTMTVLKFATLALALVCGIGGLLATFALPKSVRGA